MFGGLASEGSAGSSYPQVFVVDSQASYAPPPPPPPPPSRTRPPPRRGHAPLRPKLLPFLVGVALFGLAVQAGCMYYLYNRTQALHDIASHQASVVLERTGNEETNEIPGIRRTRPPVSRQKPSAHLTGPSSPPLQGESEVQWSVEGDAFTHLVDYKDGRLTVTMEGLYYVYSRVCFVQEANAAFLLKVQKLTEGYQVPQELMKAKRFQEGGSADAGHFSVFVGGVFRLLPGDVIYVTVSDGSFLRLGAKENFTGLFMI